MSKGKFGARLDGLANRVNAVPAKSWDRLLIVLLVIMLIVALFWTPASNWATLYGRSADTEQVQVISTVTGEVTTTITDDHVGAAKFSDDRVNVSSGSGWRLDTTDAVLFATNGTRLDVPDSLQGSAPSAVRGMADDLKGKGAKYAVVVHQDGYVYGVYPESETPTKNVTRKGQTMLVFNHAEDGQPKRIGVVGLNYEIVPLDIL